MTDGDWHGFAGSFAAAVRPEGGDTRSGVKRMLVTGVVTLVVASLAALIAGVLGLSGADAGPARLSVLPGTTKQPYPDSTAKRWTAVAGPGCTRSGGDGVSGDGNSSSFAAYGYDTQPDGPGRTGWTTTIDGGYRGAGCDGSYLSVPVSGRPTAYDLGRFTLWSFDFSASFRTASCRLSTYVPRGRSVAKVGGDPAHYFYYGTDYTYGSGNAVLGTYQVTQTGKQGRWVTGSAFQVTSGRVTVKLVDAGLRQTRVVSNVHVAAAQVRLTCTAA